MNLYRNGELIIFMNLQTGYLSVNAFGLPRWLVLHTSLQQGVHCQILQVNRVACQIQLCSWTLKMALLHGGFLAQRRVNTCSLWRK